MLVIFALLTVVELVVIQDGIPEQSNSSTSSKFLHETKYDFANDTFNDNDDCLICPKNISICHCPLSESCLYHTQTCHRCAYWECTKIP